MPRTQVKANKYWGYTYDDYCPIKALNNWLEVARIDNGPLFYKINKSNNIEKYTLNQKNIKMSLTDSHFVLMLKKRAGAADLEDCDKITTEEQRTENQRTLKESCYLDVAELKGDKSICEMIKTDYRKELCYTNVVRVTGDTSICEAHEDYTRKRDDCYEDIAIAKNDESFCAEINQDYAKRDDCYIIIAYKKGDTSICNTIENRDWLRYHSYYDELCQ